MSGGRHQSHHSSHHHAGGGHHEHGGGAKGVSGLYIFLAVVIAAIGYIAGATVGLPGNSPERGLESEESAHFIKVVQEEDAVYEAEEKEHSGLDWEETLSLTDLRTIIGIVLALILLTVAFEVAKETLEESVPEDFEVILEKFFGELTILGFLSMCTFLISKTGIIEKLSEHIFGEEEELLEYIEFVHFALFFIMISFVIQVLGMIREAEEQQHEWARIDESIRHERSHSQTESEHDLVDAIQKRPWYMMICTRFWSGNNYVKAREEAVFKALRREFILDRDVEHPHQPANRDKRVQETFNFGRYLGLAQIHILSHIVEIQLITWAFCAVAAVGFYGIAVAVHERVMALGWVWVACGWLVFLGNFVFVAHLISLRNSYLPNFADSQTDESTSLAHNGDSNGGDLLPRWTCMNLEQYIRKRPFLAKCFVGGVPNKQQAHFWMDRSGPRFYLFLFEVNLIFAGIYAGLLLLEFIPFAYHQEPLALFVLYVVLAILPLFGILYNKRDLVAILAQVCSIGTYRKDQIVRDVLVEEATTRIVRTFIIIHRMRRVAERGLPMAEPSHRSITRASTFSALEKEEVGHSFEAFDVDKSGSITKDEFRQLMSRLGADVEEEHFDRLVSSLDTDGDGTVTKSEFTNWYQYYAGKDNLSLKERAEDLFEMFDRNGSGEITLGEFKSRIDALNMDFSMDEIGAILHELDRDRNGSVSLEEFEYLLKKFYPEELTRRR